MEWKRVAVLILAASMALACGIQADAVDQLQPSKDTSLSDDDYDPYEDDSSTEGTSTTSVQTIQDKQAEYQRQIDALNSQRAELKKEQDAINKKISSTKNEMDRKVSELNGVEQNITIIEQDIKLLEERIQLLEKNIELKMEEIENKQLNMDETYEQYKKRMQAMFLQGEGSQISMLLGSSDYSDYIIRKEAMNATVQHDNLLLEDLKKQREDLEAEKVSLEESKRSVEADRKEAQEKKKELDAAKNKVSSEVHDLSVLEKQYQQNAAELKKRNDAIQARIDQIFAQIDMTTQYVGGELGWPLPGFTYISSAYGSRFGGADFHTGMDIARTPGGRSCYGASVKAANSGKVITASYDADGYGNYVILDHGGGMATLYGHMSALSVSQGQSVSKGQEVGKVGSTGWATGPHLHFEVRVNGKHTNPWSYVTGG